MRRRRHYVSRSYFAWVFERDCHQEGRRVSSRREETAWVTYRGIDRCYRHAGGAFRTAKPQRAEQLKHDGRERVTRTVRRMLIDLERMELIAVTHIKKSGAARRVGELDCLELSLKNPSFVTPRFAEPQRREKPPPGVSPDSAEAETTTSTTLIAPPSAADDIGPPSGGHDTGKEKGAMGQAEQLDAQIRFQQMKIDMGFNSERSEAVQAELMRRRREIRATDDRAAPSPEPKGSDG